MDESIQITSNPPEMKSQDFAFLREEGIKRISEIASETWTDHNLHDPGITILEACSYAITEMGLRSGMDMRDLVASDTSGRKQEFYTAAEILPVSAIALRDFRKILIDHPVVQNAWLFPLSSVPSGKYTVLLEFVSHDDPEINSNTFHTTVIPVLLGSTYQVDLAFPYWDEEDVQPFTEDITLISVAFEGLPGSEWVPIEGSDVFFAKIKISYQFGGVGPVHSKILWIVIQITTPMDNSVVEAPPILAELQAKIISLVDTPSEIAIVRQFYNRVKNAHNNMVAVRRYLHDYRNLCEDFAEFKAVRLQEIAVSAIIELNPGVIIENLLADIFFSIDRFIAPENVFESLGRLREKHVTEKIYEGPLLNSGFIPDVSLSNTNLPDILYTSDILRLILQHRNQREADVTEREDIGARNIAAVRSLSLANYLDNRPITSNARDCLHLVESQRHIPRLSLTKSRIIFLRNGIEVSYDLKTVINLFNAKKEALILEQTVTTEDIKPPEGEVFSVGEYYPIQNDLPLIYGVGEAGLPETVTDQRKALALQLKAYLFFFEQLTAGIASQLSNINSFFSADPELKSTLFQQPLYHLPQVEEILKSFDIFNPAADWENFQNDPNNGYVTALRQSLESSEQFLNRRNRVLNHLLAVFGEDMYDRSALAYNNASFVPDAATLDPDVLEAKQAEQRNIASGQLIRDKSAFIYDLPVLNRDRAQSFGNPLTRINELLIIQAVIGGFTWFLTDENGTTLFRNIQPSATVELPASESECRLLAEAALSLATSANNYSIRPEGAQFRLVLKQTPTSTKEVAESVQLYNSQALAGTGITDTVQIFLQLWLSYTVTPLEIRLYHMLGIELKGPRQLQHTVGNFFEIFDDTPPPPFRKRFRLWELSGFTGDQLLVSDLIYTGATNIIATDEARTAINTVITRGIYFNNYAITNPAPNDFRVVLLAQDGSALAHSPSLTTSELANEELSRIRQHIFRFYSFHLIEHLLISTNSTTDPVLNIEGSADPYSFQMSFVFPSGFARNFTTNVKQPGYPEMYRDLEFRKYAEQQIRKACPSHILPRVLWVDQILPGTAIVNTDPSFDNFEQSYRAWLTAYLTDGIQLSVIAPLRNDLVKVLNLIYADQES